MIETKLIPEALKNFFEKNDKVVALVLVGSFARDTVYTATEYSDMEIYVVVKDDAVEEIESFLPSAVSKIGEIIFSYKNQWAGFSTVFENLFRLEMPVVKQSDLAQVFSRPKAQIVKVIIDRTGGQLETALQSRPETLDLTTKIQDKYLDFLYTAVYGVQYFKKGELWNSRQVLGLLQSSLIKLFELVDSPEALLLEPNKRVEKFLSQNHLNELRSACPDGSEEEIRAAFMSIINSFMKQVSELETSGRISFPKKDIGEKIVAKLRVLLGDLVLPA